ncbi:hypothetical protein ES705_05828 [subsurface metagenome]|jgi:hypothetical protein
MELNIGFKIKFWIYTKNKRKWSELINTKGLYRKYELFLELIKVNFF